MLEYRGQRQCKICEENTWHAIIWQPEADEVIAVCDDCGKERILPIFGSQR
jgi:hypothetical protein